MVTYVFEFCNLYLPKGTKYVNKDLGIRIVPLKFAEKFENKRREYSEPYNQGIWMTARCFINAKSEVDAKELAHLLEQIYSFAQSRVVLFTRWYPYTKGRKYSSWESKFMEFKHNRDSEMVFGVCTGGPWHTRDISLFVDTSLDTLMKLTKNQRDGIIVLMRALHISESEMVSPLKYLACWIALEKLANHHYIKIKSRERFFDSTERDNLKENISSYLDELLKDDPRVSTLKRNFRANYLYELNTYDKMHSYLSSLELGFDEKKLEKMLEQLVQVRRALAHHLDSEVLNKKPQLLNYLRKIARVVVLRLLGISLMKQKRYILHGLNYGKEL